MQLSGAGAIRLLARSLFFCLVLGTACLPTRTRADETTGTWTGEVRLYGHYFLEKSTRVMLPEIGGTLVSPDGLRITADYLVDAITSASIAFAGSTEDDLFTEYRHQPQLTIGKEFRLANSKLDLTALGRYSTENDYESMAAGGNAKLSLNEDNTKIGVSIVGLHDEVRRSNDANFDESLDNWTLNTNVEQVLNRTTIAILGYQVGVLNGFMGNAYRRVQREGAPVAESPPRSRTRHTVYSKLQTYIPPLHGAVHLMFRVYRDTWDILALNPEVRFYKEFGDHLLVRLRYRFYTQNAADFIRDVYPADWDGPLSNDPKLRPIQSHMVGVRIDVDNGFLANSALDLFSNTAFYLSVDFNKTTISFGNEVLGSAGGIWRF